jgi:hypothetical protein
MDTAAPSSSETLQSAIDAKIMADLGSLQEKMDLCAAMLHPDDGSPAPSLKNNEALLGVIGFLEACASRMVELVEAAAQGALSEDVLCQCLSVNDRLLKQLTDIDTYSFTETPASTTAATFPQHNQDDDVEDLFLENNQADSFALDSKATAAKANATDASDPFGNDLLGLSILPTENTVEDGKMHATNSNAAGATKIEDDFDDFLSGRTNS